jgi:putative restriction endonuclease
MSSYNFTCCVSGVSLPSLLEACHIVDWANDTVNRTNPKNGLCMNSFFHKAYDNHLLAITPDMNIVVSDELLSGSKETTFYNYLKELNGKSILIPDKFLPQRELLDIHYQKYILR